MIAASRSLAIPTILAWLEINNCPSLERIINIGKIDAEISTIPSTIRSQSPAVFPEREEKYRAVINIKQSKLPKARYLILIPLPITHLP